MEGCDMSPNFEEGCVLWELVGPINSCGNFTLDFCLDLWQQKQGSNRRYFKHIGFRIVHISTVLGLIFDDFEASNFALAFFCACPLIPKSSETASSQRKSCNYLTLNNGRICPCRCCARCLWCWCCQHGALQGSRLSSDYHLGAPPVQKHHHWRAPGYQGSCWEPSGHMAVIQNIMSFGCLCLQPVSISPEAVVFPKFP